MTLYTSLNSICTMRGPLMGPRSLSLYRQARALSVKAVTFQSDPLGPLLQLEALSAARCAAEVLL